MVLRHRDVIVTAIHVPAAYVTGATISSKTIMIFSSYPMLLPALPIRVSLCRKETKFNRLKTLLAMKIMMGMISIIHLI